MPEDPQTNALRMLQSTVDVTVKIPERVFAPQFNDVFVMDFGWLVDPKVVGLLKMLMASENSAIVVISKLSELNGKPITLEQDVFVIDRSTSEESYANFLRRNWHEALQKSAPPDIKKPWTVFANMLAACSEKGSWCLYGDRFAEIALLAFRSDPSPFLTRRLKSEFKCVGLAFAFANNWLGLGRPVNDHHRGFCESLRKSYIWVA
jgi:hypothetical protein